MSNTESQKRACASKSNNFSDDCAANVSAIGNELSLEIAMRVALKEAQAALAHGDVPIGAAVIFAGKIIAKAHNRREIDQDPMGHAELLVLAEAARVLGSWRLNDCTIVVTLEPCPMCSGAISSSRINKLVFGARDPKTGAAGSLYNIVEDVRLPHRVEVTRGVLQGECAELLTEFFKQHR